MSCPCSRCFSNPSTPHSESPSSPPPYSPSATSPGASSANNKSSGFPWFKKTSSSANAPRYSVESNASDLVGLLGRDTRRTTTTRRDNGVGSGIGWSWSGEVVGR
ncbi:hypothetical protein B0T20DRAFT_394167 [Sordaria brevicollis]|uniref:Uncharacterized protein n=1 Tax=Sordaria brevicollis TaxID=83679 RepID=A0AAE0UAW1_SORBR|nr:hypothetical protein B0T20DRAFT_394167 [Sordaria brevicollis]